MAVGASGWVFNTGNAAFTFTTTPKTILNVIAAANRAFKLVEVYIGFRGGTDAADEPITVELCQSTNATAGTSAASVTAVATDGSDAQTVQSTGGRHYTAEPTVLTVLKTWNVHPQTDRLIQLPLGREVKTNIADALALRGSIISGGTSPTECTAYFEIEE